jgi:hypothetical protein
VGDEPEPGPEAEVAVIQGIHFVLQIDGLEVSFQHTHHALQPPSTSRF